MIKKCNSDSYDVIMEYIGEDYYKCLYFYLNMKKYFYTNENVNVFIQYDDDKIMSIIMLYYSSMHIFSKSEKIDSIEIIDFIEKVKPNMICAEKRIIKTLEKNINYVTEYGVIRKMQKTQLNDIDLKLELAKEKDFDQITALLMSDKGLSGYHTFDSLKEQLLNRYKDGFCRNFIYKQDDKVITHVCSGAEDEKIIILTDLIVDKDYRGMSYGKKACQAFCKIMQDEGKDIYLVSYTPTANSLYDKIGFDICLQWGKMYIDKGKEKLQ